MVMTEGEMRTWDERGGKVRTHTAHCQAAPQLIPLIIDNFTAWADNRHRNNKQHQTARVGPGGIRHLSAGRWLPQSCRENGANQQQLSKGTEEKVL